MDEPVDNAQTQSEQIRTVRPNLVMYSPFSLIDVFLPVGVINLALTLFSETYRSSYLPIFYMQSLSMLIGLHLMSAGIDGLVGGGSRKIDFEKHF